MTNYHRLKKNALALAFIFGVGAVAAPAFADVPVSITQQGRILADDGSPLTGQHTLEFTLYDAATDGTILWSDQVQVELDSKGVYSVILGDQDQPIDSTLLEDGEVYLALKVGDTEFSPRLSLTSVPFAAISQKAKVSQAVVAGAITSESLADGAVTAEKIASIPWEKVSDLPDDVASFAALSCGPNQVALYDGTDWTCSLIGTEQLADGAVTTEKLAAGAVTNAQIAEGAAIDPTKIEGTAATLQGGANFTGAVEASSFRYRSSLTGLGSYNMSALAFVSDDRDAAVYALSSTGYGFLSNVSTSRSLRIYSPVVLPARIQVGGLTCRVYDNSSSDDLTITARLRRRGWNETSATTIATLTGSTTGNNTNIHTFTESMSHQYDNVTAEYWVDVLFTPTTTAASSFVRFYGCSLIVNASGPGFY